MLAYSGGLDTSVILKWLQDTYQCEIVNPFTKNLDYELANSVTEADLARFIPTIAASGNQAFSEFLVKRLHRRSGATYIVDQRLSDDLKLTDFNNSKFEDIAWPASSIEFNFQDPELGTILMCHLTRTQTQAEAHKLHVDLIGHTALHDHEHQLTCFAESVDRSGTCMMLHNEHTWPSLMRGEAVPQMAVQG